jgi:hypothetical protein
MYSQKQIENWQEYEDVRQGGLFNMFDPRARDMTSLSVAEWLYCMEHYSALKKASEETVE